MSLLSLVLTASAESLTEEESLVTAPHWVYGVTTLAIMTLLLFLVTRLNLNR
jgi:hypothetical protein